MENDIQKSIVNSIKSATVYTILVDKTQEELS